jgi:hypothetical protein
MATTPPTTPGSTIVSDPLAGSRSAASSTLSEWAAPYVTDLLSSAQALGKEGYQVFEGPLTAGPSALQTKAFEGLAGLTIPTGTQTTYTPQTFTADIAKSYMSPYLQGALDPQIAEARRQSGIERAKIMGGLAGQGGLGGGRQAIMESELNRALLSNLAGITGKGYQTAYDKAMEQFNVEQARQQSATKQAQDYGLATLAAQTRGGDVQRAIEQEGITAERGEFQKQAEFPYKQLEFQRQMLQNLPISTAQYSYNAPSNINQLVGILSMLGTGAQNPAVQSILKDALGIDLSQYFSAAPATKAAAPVSPGTTSTPSAGVTS